MSKELWQTLGPHVDTYELAITKIVPAGTRKLQLYGRRHRFEAALASPHEAAMKRTAGDVLAHQGQRLVQRHLQNVYQERARRVDDGKVMYVTNTWDGRPLQVTPNDVLQAGENLALLHRALKHGSSELEAYSEFMEKRAGTWIDRLQSTQQLFTTEKMFSQDRVGRENASAWTGFLDKWSDLASRAVETMRRAGYESWSQAESDAVAWNGYKLSSLVRLPDGRMAVNQTSSPVLDNPLYDLASLCLDVADSGHVDGVMETIEAYALRRPLTKEDRTIVLAFVAFPHRGLRALQSVRNGRMRLSSDTAWKRRLEQQLSTSNALLEKTRG